MSDAPASDIIDIGPALLARKRKDCKHTYADVDDHAASLTCRDCGAELDPWWFLRRLAHDEDGARARIAHFAELEEKARVRYNAAVASMNAKLEYQTAEVNRLIAIKNRLWNERHPDTGEPLGSLGRRRRKIASGKPSTEG